MKGNKKIFKNAFERIIMITLLAIFVALLFLSIVNDMYAFVKSSDSILIDLDAPASLYGLSKELSDKGVINNPTVFYLYARSKGRDKAIEGFAGQIWLNRNMSYEEILQALLQN